MTADGGGVFDTRITAVAARSRARLVFSVGGVWRGDETGARHTAAADPGSPPVSSPRARGVDDVRSTATLSGVVTEAGTDHRLPVDGTLTVRLGRVVHTELHLRFGDGRITAASAVDLAPTSLPRIVGQTQQLLGQVRHQVTTPGRVSLPGVLDGGTLEPQDVEVSIDLLRLLRVALHAVR